MSRVRMPANIEQEDKILAGLTVRQLLIMGIPGIAVWAGLGQLHAFLPLPVLVAIAVPLMGTAVALALVRRDGLSLDQLTVAALRFLRAPRHRATATPAVADIPSWISADTPPLPAPLDLPVEAISDDGVLDLGEHGTAIVLRCSTVNFSLRTEAEQAALVNGFAGFVNSLTSAPVQVLVRAESVQLDPLVDAVDRAAPGLPHPSLEAVARDHADFLADLAEDRDLLYRQVLLVLRDPGNQSDRAGAAALRRRAEDAGRALAAAGSHAHVLDGPAVATVLVSAATPTTRTPPPDGLAAPDAVITSPQPEHAKEDSDGTPTP